MEIKSIINFRGDVPIMRTEFTKDALALTYKALNDQGSLQRKSVVISNLNTESSNEQIYEVALLIKDLLAFATERILRRYEIEFLED